MSADGFVDRVTRHLAALPGVRAVTLGGSRAQHTHREDSDWDVGIYYRGTFDPQDLRDLGWPGQVYEIGGWGDGVFNGGAWLRFEGRQVDVHYRDLDVIDHELAETNEGRFRIEPLMFHLAGIPSYLVVAELAINQVLHGQLPRPGYPTALRRNAPRVWWERATVTTDYARRSHARHGRLIQCVGLLAQAASQAAHAVLAARGEWVTNEKTLLTRAGLREIDNVIADALPDPRHLTSTVDTARELLSDAVRKAEID
ncbi:MAG TPA: nucleotidyltransferase domain-containing protein [Pseudonocardiaceae bacterium]|nr:nucleotidyltransferase domain-containing protein [Pseudonocardiaceae bacterium]